MEKETLDYKIKTICDREFLYHISKLSNKEMEIYRNTIELPDFSFHFNSLPSSGFLLGFSDKRIPTMNFVSFCYIKPDDFNREPISDIAICGEPVKTQIVNTVFKNDYVNSFVDYKITKYRVPEKYEATKFNEIRTGSSFLGHGVYSGNYAMIPSEFTKRESYMDEWFDEDEAKYNIEREMPKFIKNVLWRIQLNDMYINYKKNNF